MILLCSPQFRVTMTVFGGGGGGVARFGRPMGGYLDKTVTRGEEGGQNF